MEDFEPSLVVTKVENGFLVRSLNEVIQGIELGDSTHVFSNVGEIYRFLYEHFTNLEKANERGTSVDLYSRDSAGTLPEEGIPE